MANTLAYYDVAKNIAVKSFIVQAPVTYAHMEMNPALQIKKKSGRKFKKHFYELLTIILTFS